MKRKTLIVFEGCDGSGKTTQAKMLQEYLLKNGKTCYLTREPGGCPFSEQVRDILMSYKNLDKISILLLIASARIEHCNFLESLDVDYIICDRFTLSTWVYQGIVDGINPHLIRRLEPALKPDITFILDVDSPHSAIPDAMYQAYAKNNTQKIAQGYRDLSEGCFLIEGKRNKEEIAQEIKKILHEKLIF